MKNKTNKKGLDFVENLACVESVTGSRNYTVHPAEGFVNMNKLFLSSIKEVRYVIKNKIVTVVESEKIEEEKREKREKINSEIRERRNILAIEESKKSDIIICSVRGEEIKDDDDFDVCSVCDRFVHADCDHLCYQSHFSYAM